MYAHHACNRDYTYLKTTDEEDTGFESVSVGSSVKVHNGLPVILILIHPALPGPYRRYAHAFQQIVPNVVSEGNSRQ